MKSRSKLLGTSAGALTGIVITSGVALANPWGPIPGYPFDETPQFADNSGHTFCHHSLTQISTDAAVNAQEE